MQQDNNIYAQTIDSTGLSDTVELQIGHIVKGVVKSCHKDFIVVLLGTKVCYLPVSEVSWINKKKLLKEKDEIEAVVVKIQENGSVMLSIKRLQDDPWKNVQGKLHVGMKIKGIIQHVFQFGLAIDIGNSITALLHKKTIGFEKDTNFFDYILLGNKLEVEIMEIDTEARKVYLKCDNFLEQYPKRN